MKTKCDKWSYLERMVQCVNAMRKDEQVMDHGPGVSVKALDLVYVLE